ncbi:hypothetical protein A0H81_11395 [Grifola frondosa]|uniref:Uncharacterized protein n=1 Tax=Grifola frondosa TaxID=5627 RepID=A0A1C7LY20_GRIFR|nr:hypothetical protein A0H81_11395 [Grifola frondosa]
MPHSNADAASRPSVLDPVMSESIGKITTPRWECHTILIPNFVTGRDAIHQSHNTYHFTTMQNPPVTMVKHRLSTPTPTLSEEQEPLLKKPRADQSAPASGSDLSTLSSSNDQSMKVTTASSLPKKPSDPIAYMNTEVVRLKQCNAYSTNDSTEKEKTPIWKASIQLTFADVVTQNDISITPSLFFLVGITTYSCLTKKDKSRQICVTVSDLVWDRAVAVIGAVYGIKDIYFPTFMHGVSFSTYARKDFSVQSSPIRATTSSPKKKKNVSERITDPVLPWNAAIPRYNGRKPFILKNFKALPASSGEIDYGTAVMVTFTVNVYRATNRNAASLNLQSIVILADPELRDADDDNDEIPDIHPGVDSATESGGDGADNGDDDDDVFWAI